MQATSAPPCAASLLVGKEFTVESYPHMVFTVVRQPDATATFEGYCGHTDVLVARRLGDENFVVVPVLRPSFPTHFTSWLNENPTQKSILCTSSSSASTRDVIAIYNSTLCTT
jgi:hypothetical protein